MEHVRAPDRVLRGGRRPRRPRASTTPSSAPWRRSPSSRRRRNSCSGSVAAAKSAAIASRRAACEPGPRSAPIAAERLVDRGDRERRLRGRRGRLLQRRPADADLALAQLAGEERDDRGGLRRVGVRAGRPRPPRPWPFGTSSRPPRRTRSRGRRAASGHRGGSSGPSCRRNVAGDRRIRASPMKRADATTVAPESLSSYIQARFDEFSRSQKDVAQYIVDHLDDVAFQTAEELARRANTSSSTVVRFTQALGFEGYPELQHSAREEYRRRHAPGAIGGAPVAATALRAGPERVRDVAGRRPRQRRGDRAQGLAARRRAGHRRDRRRRPSCSSRAPTRWRSSRPTCATC